MLLPTVNGRFNCSGKRDWNHSPNRWHSSGWIWPLRQQKKMSPLAQDGSCCTVCAVTPFHSIAVQGTPRSCLLTQSNDLFQLQCRTLSHKPIKPSTCKQELLTRVQLIIKRAIILFSALGSTMHVCDCSDDKRSCHLYDKYSVPAAVSECHK